MRASGAAIVGIGFTPFRSIIPDVSFREMVFEAVRRAYKDAGVISNCQFGRSKKALQAARSTLSL